MLKFSRKNRKYFTVGNPMAFPIVKMENNPPKFPLSVGLRWPPSNTAMPRPTARTTPSRSSDGWGTVAHVRRKVPIGHNGAPQIRSQNYSLPKLLLPVDRSPNRTTGLIPGPVRPMMPNGIRIRSAVSPQCTGQTDTCTHRPTDRSSTGKSDDYSLLHL